MKRIHIPGYGLLELENLVLDLNGTITESGALIPGVLDGLAKLTATGLNIYVLSGDTRGSLGEVFAQWPSVQTVVTKTAREKRLFVEKLDLEKTVCIGNGNIDIEMFKVAKLSICTIQAEGAAVKAILACDVLVNHIQHAFDILLDADKMIATLRA